ncbi:MAG: response regulator [Campylobacterota bacterium]|nr:response regulator [Campylobacterota bacterium]
MSSEFKPTILYVEDEAGIREQLSKFLNYFAKELFVAKDGQEGLELFKKHKPDIVVSDIKMPNMNGIEMALAIKEINPKQHIIFTTAHSESGFFMEAIDMQVDGYILKPINLEKLEYKIEVISEQINLKRENEKHLLIEAKLNSFINLFGQHVISSSTDTKGIITNVTQSFCEISGYTKEELIGQPHNIIRDPQNSSEMFQDMWKIIQSGENWDGVLKNSKKNGGYYWVKTTIIPDFNSDGVIIGYTSIRHDITSQKAKDQFMANVSHELRTPLNAIIGFSSMLSKKLQKKNYIEMSRQINSSSKSLLSIINDILDLSKIEDSSFKIDPYEFNAYEEAYSFSLQFQGLAYKKAVHFITEIDESLKATFFGDWSRISQIILNLISNAVKFTPQDGEIKYSLEYKEENLIITVSDNGIGMSAETQDRIFKPFEQADGSTTREYGGTGLGLSITQNLLELMDAKIELESELHKGSSFKVTLPLKKVQEPQGEEHQIAQDGEKSMLNVHILVAEDNKTNQMLITMLLEEIGVTCDIANDGLEAVEMYNPKHHKLILMDENMPNMNGTKAMQVIKEKYKNECGAVVALTANAMLEDRDRFLALGMDEYITKPIDEDELYRVLKEFS